MYIDSGYPISAVLKILEMPRSSYYYKEKSDPKIRGVKRSQFTRKQGGVYIRNEHVVKDIQDLLGMEFIDYGYLKTTYWLRKEKGYLISKKKVYLLMKENGLLNRPARSSRTTNRNWVKELVPQPTQAMEFFEMDIKYIYIQKMRRSALLLTAIDVESRWVMGHKLSWQIHQQDVQELFNEIFTQYQLPLRIYVRNDNGPQFIAQSVQEYFKGLSVIQEFTKPATPEQNAHIESYHSILERVICQRYDFETIQEARETLDRFVRFYNLERIHSGIGYLSPYEYLKSKKIEIGLRLNDPITV